MNQEPDPDYTAIMVVFVWVTFVVLVAASLLKSYKIL
jgi:hypothetical protein